jgi:Flp pilus assembly protein TadG
VISLRFAARRRGNPRCRCADDRGSATVWMIGVTVSAFLMIGLVLDGGVMLRARSDAFALAASAARVGAQQLDSDAAVEGQAVLDPVAAEQAALAYLSANGVTGSVTVADDTVRVRVTTTADLQLLSLVGGGSATFDATAEAQTVKVVPP